MDAGFVEVNVHVADDKEGLVLPLDEENGYNMDNLESRHTITWYPYELNWVIKMINVVYFINLYPIQVYMVASTLYMNKVAVARLRKEHGITIFPDR